jgi:phosphotransferase family enzyme
MLETTLTSSFVPGVNIKGAVAGANWMFLRPSIPSEHLACLGVPSESTLATLVRFSGTVTIVAGARQARAAEMESRRAALSNVRWCAIGGGEGVPLPDGAIDTLMIAGYRSQWRLWWDWRLRREVRRLLRGDALVYSEQLGAFDVLSGARRLLSTAATRPSIQRFQVTPIGGEVHTAIPDGDQAMARYFRRQSLYSSTAMVARATHLLKLAHAHLRSQIRTRRFVPMSRPKIGSAGIAPPPQRATQPRAQGGGVLADTRSRVDHLLGRRGVLMGAAGARLSANPPEYLRTIAAASGIRLDQFRWALSARGEYSSRKLLFFLTDRSADPNGPPTYIAKMVRDSAFSPRLENEHRALTLLRERRIGDADTVPRSVFFGHHAGLAIVGETVIDGVPFLERSSVTGDCPYLHGALDWFTALGAEGAGTRMAASRETAATLGGLFARFQELYQLPGDEERFLRGQIAVLGAAGQSMPLVLQHGDPGVWNMLATPRGRVAVLDWESAETEGIPLWDLFYFLRTYAVAAARAAGTRDALAGFSQELLRCTPLSRVAGEAVRRYCTRVRVPSELIEPLFYTCWMHRALKEATRLTSSQLGRGRYVGLLRHLISRASTLQDLFAA